MKTRNIATYIIFGIILTAAIVGIIYGVVTHREPGFTDETRRWAQDAPLTVWCVGYSPADDDACGTVENVVGVVNTRLGFHMLQWAASTTPDIHFVMRAPVEVGADEPGGHYELRGTGATYEHCEVRTMNASGGASDLEWLVVYHELGHCLGLAHDDFTTSIMYPMQQATPDRAIPPWISDYDRSLLRIRYAP